MVALYNYMPLMKNLYPTQKGFAGLDPARQGPMETTTRSLSIKEINSLRQNARSVIRELGLLNDAYFEIGVTLAERHLLIELGSSHERITAKEIAERLFLDKSTVSRLVAKAVKKGYITCTTDKEDKRKRFLELTELGTSTLNTFEPIAFTQTQKALQTLTIEEAQLACRGVALYAQGLKNSRLQNREPTSSKTWNMEQESLELVLEQIEQRGYQVQPYQAEDEPALYAIFQEVVDSGCQFPYESSALEEFRKQFLGTDSQLHICRNQKGDVIGGFYLKANYSGRSNHIANAAYMLEPSHRGKGLGTLLIKASLYIARDLDFQSMQYNMVLSQHSLATKLYQKLGFAILATIPKAIRNPDGSFQDGYMMHRELNPL